MERALLAVKRGLRSRQPGVFARARVTAPRFLVVLAWALVWAPGCAEANESGDAEARVAIASVRSALALDDRFLRAEKLAEALRSLDRSGVGPVRELLQDPYRALEPTDSLLLIRYWATHEPETATRWCVTACPISWRGAGVEIAAGIWALEDPAAVLARYGHRNQYVSDALVASWFDSGAPGLEEHVMSLGDTVEGQRALSILVRKKIESDGSAAVIEWAQARKRDERSTRLLYRKVASELAMFDRPAALRWCDAHCNGPYGETMRLVIARRWAADDGRAAMDWVARTSDTAGKEKKLAARGTYRVWAKADREAAFQWIRSIDEKERGESWLQPVVGIYVAAVSWEDPREALRWAELLQDEGERELARISIARRWRKTDEEAAEAWLETSPLSEAARQKAREEPKTRGRGGAKPAGRVP